MIDLTKISGLPVELADDLRIKFYPPMQDREPTYIRMFSQVQGVLKDPDFKSPTQEMYLGYRQLYLPEHADLVRSDHLEYDLTIIPPMMLGEEYNKTVGHYHAAIPGTKIAHPEMYEILNGHVLILWQKMDEDFKNLISVYAVEAKTGDKIIYPPNYGHILVNIGTDILVTANWLSTDYKPLYEPVADFHGMAYYVIKGNGKLYDFVKNPHYSDHPDLKLINEQQQVYTNFGFVPSEPMYTSGMKNPKLLEFLNHPQKYAVQLSTLTS
ncbi:MAG: glucose-6-phosphate isomerase family protein [Candidatus Doudnabacteria bacterium]